MNKTTSFPYSTDIYFSQHPEKFEKRRQPIRMIKNLLIALVGLLVLIFPDMVPFLKLWLIYLGGIVAVIYGIVMIWVEGTAYFNLQSGGEVKYLEIKKFRNSRDERVWNEVLKAFADHDFAYLAEAPGAKNQPLQLFICEDKKGREFYLQIKGYNEHNVFEPLTDVVTISGSEYDANAELIHSMKTDEE